MTEWVDAARVAAGIGGLAVASWSDIKSREVKDGLWFALAVVALALMAFDFNARFGGASWALVLAVGAVFIVAVTGGEIITVLPGDTLPEGPIELTDAQSRLLMIDYAISLAILGGAVAVFLIAPSLDLGTRVGPLVGPQAQAYSACLMLGAALLFYAMGALHGGADAKGFMVLALLFPVAPAILGLPLIAVDPLSLAILPFALVVLFNGALVQVVGMPLWFSVRGLMRGQFRWPLSLAGYPKPVEAVDLERDFLMGTVKDGVFREHFILSRRSHSDSLQREGLEALRKGGVKTVFVTPKAPFMAYMLAGLIVAVILTSPLHWILLA